MVRAFPLKSSVLPIMCTVAFLRDSLLDNVVTNLAFCVISTQNFHLGCEVYPFELDQLSTSI